MQPFKKQCGLWAIVVNAAENKYTVMVCCICRHPLSHRSQGSKTAVEKAQMLRDIHFEYVCV
jgi:hypothetical protein